MRETKLISVLERYRDYLASQKVDAVENDAGEGVKHAHWMCLRCLEVLIPGGKKEKALVWLGFIQCILLVHRIFTLKELRDHNREIP